MSKHTPGPWVEFADHGDTVMIMPAMRPGNVANFAHPYPSREDARLIAAAPDGLALARKVVAYFRDGPTRPGPRLPDIELLAQALIVKAEGR